MIVAVKTLRVVSLAIGVAFVAGAQAQRAAPDVRAALAGTWRLVSIYEENASGEELDRWGSDRNGRFIADRHGHFMLQLTGRNPIRLESPLQSRCRGVAAAYENIAYAGTFAVDEERDALALKIADAIAPDFEGSVRTTAISLEGEELHFRSAAELSPTGAFYAHLVWRRLN